MENLVNRTIYHGLNEVGWRLHKEILKKLPYVEIENNVARVGHVAPGVTLRAVNLNAEYNPLGLEMLIEVVGYEEKVTEFEKIISSIKKDCNI